MENQENIHLRYVKILYKKVCDYYNMSDFKLLSGIYVL